MTNSKKSILSLPYFQLIASIVVVFVVYGKTLKFDLVLDDDLVINNKHVQRGVSGIPDIMSSGYLSGFNGASSTYRPLPLVTFALEQSIHGLNPIWSRIFQLILYALAVVLLIQLAKLWFSNFSNSLLLFVGLLFLLNPIHTEVVCNLKSRDELLAVVFVLLTLFSVSKYRESKSLKWLIYSGMSALLAFMSKENAVMLFVFVPLLNLILFKNGWIESTKASLGVALATILYFSIRYVVLDANNLPQEQFVMNNAFVQTTLFERVGNSAYLLLLYVFKALIPYKLTWDYSYSTLQFHSITSLIGGVSLLAVLAGFALLVWKRKSVRNYLILVAGFVLFLVTVLNFFVLIGANFAERFLMIPSVFVALLLGLVFNDLIRIKKLNEKSALLVCTALSMFYGVVTINRASDWKDNETLFFASLETNPESARVQTVLGNLHREKAENMQPSMAQEQMYRKAFSFYDAALNILPEAYEALYNKGVIYQQTGGVELANQQFLQVIQIDSNHVNALNNLGVIYYNEKDISSAEKYWTKAYSITQNDADVVGNMGVLYHSKREYAAAVEYYKKSLQINPNQPVMLKNLEVAQSQL